MEKQNSAFSEFFRNASDEEKKRVYTLVAEKATKRQLEILGRCAVINPKITKASKQYKEHMEWVFAGAIPIWERANVQRVVSMAANIVDGHLIVGNRHFCPIMQMTIDNLGLRDENHCQKSDQGFVDQWGVYMDRKEAWVVAKAAGQIKEVFTEGVLYSECYL